MYTASGKPDKDQQVERYVPLVKRLAFQLSARLPANVEIDDLIQTGMLGLMDALNRFQEMGAQFETYATTRIKGAMLDGLRREDSLPRLLRQEMRKIEKSIEHLEQKLQRSPTQTEIANDLKLPLAQYQKILQDAKGHQVVYWEDLIHHNEGDEEDFLARHFADDSQNPEQILESQSFKKALVAAIHHLSEREKLVMALYYEQDLNLKEIGAVLNVTESRVCQLHSQAMARLRVALKKHSF